MNTKKRILWSAAALMLVAAPAVVGLWGNASFAESVPVRVPAAGRISSPSPSPAFTSTPSPSPQSDDDGGDVPRDQRLEPGDDRRVHGDATPAPSTPSRDDDRSGDDHRADDQSADDHRADDSGGDD